MKKLIPIFFLLIVTKLALTQDFYTPLSFFTEDEQKVQTNAKDMIDKGHRMVNMADNDFNKYRDLLTSNSKGKNKRGEKKTVDTKKNLQIAANYYLKGYKSLIDFFNNKLLTAEFEFEEDRKESEKLQSEAEKKFKEGEQIVQKIIKYEEEALKKDIKLSLLISDVKKAETNFNQAATKLYQALLLLEKQEEKKRQEQEKEEKAWKKAMMNNTLESYQEYLVQYPNGKYSDLAKQLIEDFENKIKEAEAKQNNPNLVYHIQILADKRKWSENEIKSKIYYTNEPIKEIFIEGWYKYWIGNFNSYDDAKKYLNTTVKPKKRDAFVIGTVNGQPVHILEALKIQQKANPR